MKAIENLVAFVVKNGDSFEEMVRSKNMTAPQFRYTRA